MINNQILAPLSSILLHFPVWHVNASMRLWSLQNPCSHPDWRQNYSANQAFFYFPREHYYLLYKYYNYPTIQSLTSPLSVKTGTLNIRYLRIYLLSARRMWLASVVAGVWQIVQVHCRWFGSTIDFLAVYGIDYPGMPSLCYHGSVPRNKGICWTTEMIHGKIRTCYLCFTYIHLSLLLV